MAEDFDREAVLAQVAERRRVAAELAEGLPQESVMDRLRRQVRERAAARAERRGELDLGGGDSTP